MYQIETELLELKIDYLFGMRKNVIHTKIISFLIVHKHVQTDLVLLRKYKCCYHLQSVFLTKLSRTKAYFVKQKLFFKQNDLLTVTITSQDFMHVLTHKASHTISNYQIYNEKTAAFNQLMPAAVVGSGLRCKWDKNRYFYSKIWQWYLIYNFAILHVVNKLCLFTESIHRFVMKITGRIA